MPTTYPPLTTYHITFNDGSTRATNMAAGITLEQAIRYFLGRTFVMHEDEATGKETKLTAIAVERIN